MIKIKARYDCLAGGYKKGDVFQAKKDDCDPVYYFNDSEGSPRMRHIDEFTIIPEEPAIEVGSEWIQDGSRYEVTALGKHSVMIYSHETNSEFACHKDVFVSSYKPKPKSVTMYFYLWSGEYVSFDKEQTIELFGPLLFTREIELP